MKSFALIIWLLGADGHERIVVRSHLDDMPACVAQAEAVAAQYAGQGRKTRHLCQIVLPENEEVDENGNPIEAK